MAGSKDKLGVGVVGVGGVARTHMPGWESSEHAAVVAGADVSGQALQAWGEKHGVTALYADAQELIADPSVSIVDICTPSMLHAPVAIAAMDAGKHVICEKPLAPSPAEIREMIAARDRNGVLLMTAQHERYQPTSRAMKAQIDTGALGEVYHARAWYLRRNEVPTRPSFLRKATAGGGPCIDIGVHILDLALWMMGHPRPISVSGVSRRELIDRPGAWSVWGGTIPQGDIDVEDFAAAFVRFDTGATLILETSWMLHHPKAEQCLWLYGREGGATWPDCSIYKLTHEPRQRLDIQLTHLPSGPEAHAMECIEFARAVAESGPSPVPAEQSLAVQLILDGLYRSQESGRQIQLNADS